MQIRRHSFPAEPDDLLQLVRLALAAKHPATLRHSDRVSTYLVWLAEQADPSLSETDRFLLSVAGMLHDVGKIYIPTHVLASPARLSPDELRLVQSHPERGSQLIRSIPVFRSVIPVVLHHHERFDGSGYPAQLAGPSIPLQARMAALVDTFDAMTGERSYRRSLTPDEALEEIIAGSGTQFDPSLVELFVHRFHHVRRLFHQIHHAQSAEHKENYITPL